MNIILTAFLIILFSGILYAKQDLIIQIYDEDNFKFTFYDHITSETHENIYDPSANYYDKKIYCHGPFCAVDDENPSKLTCDGKVILGDSFDGTYMTENDYESHIICTGDLGEYKEANIESYIVCERAVGKNDNMISKNSCFLVFYPDFIHKNTKISSIRLDHKDLIKVPVQLQDA